MKLANLLLTLASFFLVMVIAFIVGSFVDFRCGDPPIGSHWYRPTADPFETPLRVTVIEKRGDYVRYEFDFGGHSSMHKCDFRRMYEEEK